MRLRTFMVAAVTAGQLMPNPVAAAPREPAKPATRPKETVVARPDAAPVRAGLQAVTAPDRAALAVAAARAQIGKPYRYGAGGPNAFDCSGLTSFAWRAAGVAIPRSSRAQYAGLPKVPLADARPGDLVFSRGHVGLYIGGGQMVHAPQSGKRVQISPIHRGTYGAARPA